ncbi:MAG: hydrogenase maturation protein HypF [Pseudomonadota bacterium]|nr:hydrogenase maturation protein HypF [Pseudomonadota bacterium]
MIARRIRIRGRVQGVGFRPFICRLARRFGLRGWVRNRSGEVDIHIEGAAEPVSAFVNAIRSEAPPLAQPEVPRIEDTEFQNYSEFRIRDSEPGAAGPIVIPPDYFVCADCLAEMSDPAARRYRYPFTNCTQCGPRYTIIDRLPYDRPHTAMAEFSLCPDCQAEYDDPADRRHHAQPLACPLCGPTLEFRPVGLEPVRGNEAALAACIQGLRTGQIVAVKGVGGYHLMCDARSEVAVQRLRKRKHRPAKPLAVLIPEQAGFLAEWATLNHAEQIWLRSPLRPIVIVPKAAHSTLAPAIAPGLGEVGLMLPYSPLHHLLVADFGGPLVATSANISGEPVLTDADSVKRRLGTVADAFLHHNRPIRRPADDSVFRRVGNHVRPLRLGRGLAPVAWRLKTPVQRPTLALGADLKNTIALAVEDRVVISPHLGDLGAPRSLDVFAQVISDLCRLYAVTPERIVCDAHPGYFSTRWAQGQALDIHRVFHHHAHASALFGEFTPEAPILVFTWDGLGFGEDGTFWGGEALLGEPGQWRRVASLRPFRLIGGDQASRDPWRCALAMSWEAGLEWSGGPAERGLVRAAWERGLNCPVTTSAGRWFDAAAALTGLAGTQSHEGQAAMALEVCGVPSREGLDIPLYWDNGLWRGDWAVLLPMLMDGTRTVEERATCFHASLAGLLLRQAEKIRQEYGVRQVGLTGGVFQNRLLTEQALQLLAEAGFEALLPERLPVNDAAISFGQIVESAARYEGQ